MNIIAEAKDLITHFYKNSGRRPTHIILGKLEIKRIESLLRHSMITTAIPEMSNCETFCGLKLVRSDKDSCLEVRRRGH